VRPRRRTARPVRAGASLAGWPHGAWAQVPLALPLRYGLLDRALRPAQSAGAAHPLAPRSWSWAGAWRRAGPLGGLPCLLQYYQERRAVAGWEGLNDLHRPWQNDRTNGTLRYLDAPFEGEEMLEADSSSCEVWPCSITGSPRSQRALSSRGYGKLGFCID